MRIEKKEVPPAKPKCEYVLTLDEREARALMSVVGKIGGPTYGPKGFTATLFNVLDNMGVPYDPAGLYFKGEMEGADTWPEEDR